MLNSKTKLFRNLFLVLTLALVVIFAPGTKAKALGGVVKQLSVGEHITAINSYPGWWQIVENGKVCWCSAGPTQYYGQSSKFPMELVVTAPIYAYQADVLKVQLTATLISAVGSVPGWWKVKGDYGLGWINAGPTEYLGQSSTFPISLYTTRDLPVYRFDFN